MIFDLDGTLVYTTHEYIGKVVFNTLQEFGISPSREHIKNFWFGTDRNNIIREHFGVDNDLFWKTFRKHDKPENRKLHAFPYSDIDIIPELRSRGFKTGIVTGASQDIIDMCMGILGRENFDAVVRAQLSSGVRPKPNPHGIYVCMEQLGVKKTEAVYAGNAAEDVLAAKAAGVFDVLVDRGEHEFPDVSPSARIKSLYEMKGLLGTW